MRRLLPLLALAAALAAPRPSTAAPPANAVPGRALVRFAAGTPAALIAAAHARANARVIQTLRGTGYHLVAFDAALPMNVVLGSYRSDPSVVAAEPNYVATVAVPNDPCLTASCAGVSGQWSLAMTDGAAAWDGASFTAAQKQALPRITVAVLDTKIDSSHPDFANSGSSTTSAAGGGQLDLVGARDWIAGSQQSGSAAYHGTYVAGLVAAATNNGSGVAAIGSRATILPLTVVDGTGRADAASLADAIVYAWQRGARIINLSLGLTADSAAVRDAIRTVTSGTSPSLVVAAAGNNTGSSAFYPGSYPEVMAVAGTSASDGSAACSNFNANVSVAAPAERVVSLSNAGGLTAPACGTSAAAPQVSGLAAVLLAQDPARSPAELRRIIERSADDLGPAGRDDRFGFGRINAGRALSAGPSATLARATVAAPTTGGSSTVTALTSSPAGVRAARAYFGSPDATPVALGATDGSFGGTTESVRGRLTIPASAAAGPHPIYVQAFDGSRWGPRTVGVVLIDGKAPVISGAAANNAVRTTAEASVVRFWLADDASPVLATGIQVFDASGREVHRNARSGVPVGASSFTWNPGSSVLPGSYQIKIVAADISGKTSATMVGIIVV